MVDSFYLTLPSNSSIKYYPDNTPSHYFTKLPEPITVHGDYEAGLSEITFTNNYCNVQHGVYVASYRKSNQLQRVFGVPAGLYKAPGEIVEALKLELHEALTEEEKEDVEIKYNSATKRTTVRIQGEEASLRVSRELANFFQTKDIEYFTGNTYKSEKMMRLDNDYEAVYVYTDLIEHRMVGDIKAPLLRIIPISQKDQDVVYYTFTKPHYIPLLRSHFNSVEMLLTVDTGKPISFDKGKTVVTLHIRRRRPNY